MNAAETLLAERRARIATLERELELARAELSGMETFARAFAAINRARPTTAALVLGATSPRSSGGGPPAPGGRQLGSISKRWRAVLWQLHALGGDFSPVDIVAAVRELEGRDMRAADAKRQMDIYIDHGFVTVEQGAYNVTSEFKSKFADSAPNGSNENEASEAKAQDASDASHGGVWRIPGSSDQPIATPASTS